MSGPEGGVVGNARGKAGNVATGAELQSTTDNTGAFRFNLIPTGTYKVDVSAPNFKTLSQTGILVNAGQDTGLGLLKLSGGDTGTTVEVTAETPLIESTQAQVTNTFSGQTLTTFAGAQGNEGPDNLAFFLPRITSSPPNHFPSTNTA